MSRTETGGKYILSWGGEDGLRHKPCPPAPFLDFNQDHGIPSGKKASHGETGTLSGMGPSKVKVDNVKY